MFKFESDWLVIDGGVITIADVFTADIGGDSVLLASKHTFLPNKIGLFGAESVEQGVAPTGTAEEKVDGLIAYLVSRGDLRLPE